MSDIIYSKGSFVVFKDSDGEYVVYNTNKPFKKGHSHLKSKMRVKEVIDKSIKKEFPLHWSSYFIETMIRLTEDKSFKDRLEKLRETRLNKGNRKYVNVGGRGV